MTGIRTHILVGYIPTPEGIAALDYAIAYAAQNAARLTVVNTGKDGDYAHPQYATAVLADGAPRNRRVDDTLLSPLFTVNDAGVFWPVQADPLSRLTGVFPFPTSDHRLVWADVTLR